MDVDKLAQEMYEDYVLSKNRVQCLANEFATLRAKIHLIPGDVDLNECIEFQRKPKLENTIVHIQEHFAFLAMQALKAGCDMLEYNNINFSGELTIYEKNGYTTTDLYSFIEGIMRDLPEADGFKISSAYSGSSIAPWFNTEVREGFRQTVEKMGTQEQFVYTAFEFLYNHGVGGCYKHENSRYAKGLAITSKHN